MILTRVRRAQRKAQWFELLITIALMTSALYLYYALTVWSLLDHLKEGPLKDYVRGPGIHIELVISSVGLAVLMVLINQWSESPRLRRRSFGRIILIKSGLYLTGILLLAALTLLALWLFVMTRDDLLALFALMTGRLFISVWGWFILSILAVNFLMEVRRKVGPGNLAALVTGKYHRPKSEDRLFLFLDLKDSTAIAETLGHERYSQLIRECFHDLTEIVVQSGASIYQYAGDEVILTWKTNEERSAEMCIAAFFAFEKKLSDRGDTYRNRYGTRPTFRAGAEAGVVTATEVGDIKRDIAYHGDPLNTAARLLDLCNSVGRRLLISDRIRQMIRESADFLIDREGEYQLRGKAAAVAVYGVSEASAVT